MHINAERRRLQYRFLTLVVTDSCNGEVKAMKPDIPKSLKIEHEELHHDLARATRAGGRTGEAAKAVAQLMHPHFVREEEFALLPLGLLGALAAGNSDPAMTTVLRLTDKLEAEMPQMIAEHQVIVAALKKLIEAAEAEAKPEVTSFAEKLMAHAQMEEEVSYPAALLVGRYLRAMQREANSKAA
jgi:hypothetical protein